MSLISLTKNEKKCELLNIEKTEDHQFIRKEADSLNENASLRNSFQELLKTKSYGLHFFGNSDDRYHSTPCLTKNYTSKNLSQYNEKYVRNEIENPEMFFCARKNKNSKLTKRSKSFKEDIKNVYAANDYEVNETTDLTKTSELNQRKSKSYSNINHEGKMCHPKLSKISEDENRKSSADNLKKFNEITSEKTKSSKGIDNFEISLRNDFIDFYKKHLYPKYKENHGLNEAEQKKFENFSNNVLQMFQDEKLFSCNDNKQDLINNSKSNKISSTKLEDGKKVQMILTDQKVEKSKTVVEKKRKEDIQNGIKNFIFNIIKKD